MTRHDKKCPHCGKDVEVIVRLPVPEVYKIYPEVEVVKPRPKRYAKTH